MNWTYLLSHCISSEPYWKTKALSIDASIRPQSRSPHIQNPWKSLYFEKLLERALTRVNWNLKALSPFERLSLKQSACYIESFTFSGTSVSLDTATTLLSWFTHVKSLTFFQTNHLLQAVKYQDIECNALHTIQFVDVHLVDKRALPFIPTCIKEITIDHARSVTSDFLDGLQTKPLLHTISITSSGLDPQAIHAIPQTIHSLDLTNSGKNLESHVLELLPPHLTHFACGNWTQCGDTETAYLPPTIESLILEGWKLTNDGLATIKNLPLTKLTLRNCISTDIQNALRHIPNTIQELDLSGNAISCLEIHILKQLTHLKKLILDSIPLSDQRVDFPIGLEELSLAKCSTLSEATIQNLVTLINLKVLRLSGCGVSNNDLSWLPLKLEFLDLSDCQGITDVGAMHLERLHSLHTLILDRCEQIRGFGLAALPHTMRVLSCQGCHRLSGKSLIHMPKNLQELHLDNCDLIEASDIQHACGVRLGFLAFGGQKPKSQA